MKSDLGLIITANIWLVLWCVSEWINPEAYIVDSFSDAIFMFSVQLMPYIYLIKLSIRGTKK